jgi:hypothetical protein
MKKVLFGVLFQLFACRSAPDQATTASLPGPHEAVGPGDAGAEVGEDTRVSFDVDATLATTVAAARSLVDAADAPVRIEEDSFVLIGDGPGALSSGAARMFHDALTALFNGRFDRHPDRPTIVIFFSTRPRYLQFAPDASIGYFKRPSREIDVDVSGGPRYESTAVHELVHSVVANDWATGPDGADPDALPPEVLDEGLASLYENPSFPAPGEIRGLRSGIRRKVLDMALASPRDVAELRADKLLQMTYAEFKSPGDPWIAARNEAFARYFMLFMEERGFLWPWYRLFKATRETDPHGLAALRHVTSLSPERVSENWVAWARSLG